MTELMIQKLREEMNSAELKYGAMNSPHEAFGVLQIEINEMADEVHARCWGKARLEAIQIAAVALRFAEKTTQLEEKGMI